MPMVPFFAQSIEDITCSSSSIFLLKDTLNKSNNISASIKFHFKVRVTQKHGQDIDPGISVKVAACRFEEKWQSW